MKKRNFHIPVFVPHKGCPHDCVFCNQRKITGQTDDMTVQKAREIIDSHLESIEKYNKKGEYKAEIAFFGGSFTAIEREQMTQLLSLAHEYVKSGRVDGVRCSTRPDCIDDEILLICKSYGMTAIELGLQSADDYVLQCSARGHAFKDTKRAAELIKSHKIELGLQMMTGLPGDTDEKSVNTAKQIVSLGANTVRIYPTLVMEGTHLWKMYKCGEYVPQTLEQAVFLVAKIVPFFNDAGIDILRIGLQTTDNVNEKTVIGPYHNAFAELVYGRVIRNKIESYVVENNMQNCTFQFEAPKEKISQIIGHKKENLIYFKEKYNIDIKLI
ncbi:MAG: radical SAM protein [Clostridia bacterium]|nr:radical SAM protein [Clostridia bacterium]